MLTRYLLPLVALATLTFAALQVVKAQQKPPPGSPPVEPAKSPYAAAVAGAGLVEPETENIAIGTHVRPPSVERMSPCGAGLSNPPLLIRANDAHSVLLFGSERSYTRSPKALDAYRPLSVGYHQGSIPNVVALYASSVQ